MSIDQFRGASLLAYSLVDLAKDLVEKNTFDEISNAGVKFISKNGDIYLPYGEKLNFQIHHSFFGESKFQGSEEISLFSERAISRQVTTVGYKKGSIDINALLGDFASNPRVYGVVIQKNDFIINPLHPAVAFLIISGLLDLPEEGNIHVFEFSDAGLAKYDSASEEVVRQIENDFYEVINTSPKLMKTSSLVHQVASVDSGAVEKLLHQPFIDRLDFNVKLNRDYDGKTPEGVESLLIPTQLIMFGVVLPYYGMIYIENPTNPSIRGYSLSPMASGNINQRASSSTFSNFASSGDEKNVCVGDANSISSKGWLTLSKVNANSMYYPNIIHTDGVFALIKAAKNVAAQIWSTLETVDEVEVVEDEE